MARPLRLMTWNVRSLRDDRDAVIRVIRACAPDVLFVQEAPRFLRSASRLAALARETDLVVATTGRPTTGLGLLTTMRVDVERAELHELTKSPKLHQRGVAAAELSVGALSFTAASLHLGLDAIERRRHAVEIDQLLGTWRQPVVLAGDFNEQQDGPAWASLSEGRQDAGAAESHSTFPASQPRRRIDTILAPHGWRISLVSALEIVDESDLVAATDHRPVIVDVMG